MAAVVHEDYTSLSTIGDNLLQIPNVSLHVFPALTSLTKTWNVTPGDASEQDFYSCQGTSITRIIPSSLGGIIFWADGPVSAVGTYVGDIITTYTLLYRGMRND